jgi:hypothetical protein
MAPKKASQFILIEALNELFIEALNNLLMITFYFLVFFRKRKPRKNTTKQWFPKNMAESAQQQDDNPQDDPGRTECTSETQLMLRQGGDVVRQEFEDVVVGQQEFEDVVVGQQEFEGCEAVDVGQLTPRRHKKRAVGKKLTPKKKNV